MENEKFSRERLNKQEKFHVLYHNPKGLRYYQNGRFFGPGGTPSDIILGYNEVPPIVANEMKKLKIVKPPVSVDVGEKQVFACPHCDKTYTDEQWLNKHIAAKHEE